MKAELPNQLGKAVTRFFQDYLPAMRGMSLHTIRGYRDAVVLFLRFTSGQTGTAIERLDVADLSAERIEVFLLYLEETRGNSVATRNARLAALHTLARFLVTEYPEHLAALQHVLGLPFKRGARHVPIEYLEADEVKALLAHIDRSSKAGRRDYALFALMFNTGARVQEILDLRLRDVRTDPPYQVRLKGKGGKTRLCPIWAHTALLLRELARESPRTEDGEATLFLNNHNRKLTRFGVRYLLKKYVAASSEAASSLGSKRIHPHSVRHSTAVALLKAGVDFATISQWLGHASLNTTMVYARADLDMKRQALTQVFPDVLSVPATSHRAFSEADLIAWLRRL
jgi:integrase/recombinase XerD